MSQNTRAHSALTTLTVILSIGASLFIGEWTLRHFYHFPDSLAPFTPFRNTLPDSHFHLIQKEFAISLDYNRQGFRDRNFDDKLKLPKKILFLGDSFIEGFGVEEHQRASNLVEKELNRESPNPTVAVFNAGQIMSGPSHYFSNLIRFGVGLKPNGVVVGLFMGNDFIGARKRPVPNGYIVADHYPTSILRESSPPLWEFPFLLTLISSSLDQNRLIQRKINTNQYWKYFYRRDINRDFFFEHSGMKQKEFDKHISNLPEDVRDDFFSGRINPSYLTSSFLSTLKSTGPAYTDNDIRNVFDMVYEMYFVCTQREIPFLLVLFPSPYQIFPEDYSTHLSEDVGYKEVPASLKELDNIHQALIDWLSFEGISSIDMKPVLKKEDFYLFDGHLNPAGQSKVADQILKKIRSWVKSGKQPIQPPNPLK